MMKKKFFAVIAAIFVLTLSSNLILAAQPFYEGKAIRIVVGFAPGGGFDVYARAIARHWGKHIPGNPAIIVDNMTGAGGLISANYIYNMAKPDGLTIGSFQMGLFLSELLGQPGIDLEGKKFKFIGSLRKDNPVTVLNKERGIKSAKEWIASKTPVKMGGVGTGNSQDTLTRILKLELGLPLQLITPYKGNAELDLAMQRGEIEGCNWPWQSFMARKAKEFERGDLVVVLQDLPEPLPELPNVTVWMELAKTKEARQIVGLFDYHNELGRSYTLPPGTPNERLQELRKAFEATIKDAQFLAEMKKANMELQPQSGEEIRKNVNEFYQALDPALIPRLKEVVYGPLK